MAIFSSEKYQRLLLGFFAMLAIPPPPKAAKPAAAATYQHARKIRSKINFFEIFTCSISDTTFAMEERGAQCAAESEVKSSLLIGRHKLELVFLGMQLVQCEES